MKTALAIGSLALFVGWTAVAWTTGGSWDRVEGLVALHQSALHEGVLDDPQRLGRFPLYGALWYRLTAVSSDAATVVLAGRWLSIASLLAVAAIGWQYLSSRPGTPRPAAALGATAWLGWLPALQFGGSDRCDAPALLLAASGWMAGRSPRIPVVALGGFLAGFSSSLRTTSGLEALAWGLVALAGERRTRQFHVAWVAGGIGGLALAAAATFAIHGQAALPWLLSGGKSGWDIAQTADLLLRLAPLGALGLAVASLGWAPRPLAGTALVSLGLAMLLSLRPGANLNWFLAPTWFLSLCLGASSLSFPKAITCLAILQTWVVQAPRLHALWKQAVATEERSFLVDAIDRPVLSSDALPVLLAGKDLAVDDPHLWEDLSAHRTPGRSPLAESLARERWAVLTDPDLLHPRGRHWSAEVRRWVIDSTRICGQVGETQLRLPREAPCPRSR